MIRRRFGWCGVLASLALFASTARAQEASISGTVTDETRAVLPGATVIATNLETGAQTSGVTDERGTYRLLSLPAGAYRIQTDLQGFASVIVPSVELLVGQNA